MEKIENPDILNEDPTYWELVLKSHNLGMARGSNQHLANYAGGLNELNRLDTGLYEKSTGKVKPKGSGVDK